MTRLSWSIVLTSAALSFVIVAAQEPKPATSPAAAAAPQSSISPLEVAMESELADRKLSDELWPALQKPIPVDFRETPPSDVVRFLSEAAKVRIRLDEDALKSSAPITLVTFKPMPVAHLLDRLALLLRLNWTVSRGEVVVTSDNRAELLFETRVYRVGKLLRLATRREQTFENEKVVLPASAVGFTGAVFAPRASGETDVAESQLMQLLFDEVGLKWMDIHGEGGTSQLLGDNLIVRQSYRGQQQVARLLRAVEDVFSRDAKTQLLSIAVDADVAESARLQRVLNKAIELAFQETSLGDVVAYLKDVLQEEIVLDETQHGENQVEADKPITLPADHYSVRVALERLLTPLELTHVVHDGAILITTKSRSHELLRTVIYDVADLLRNSGDLQTLIQVILESVRQPWVERDGEGGVITDFLGGVIVIRQTDAAHGLIELLLRDLRQSAVESAKDSPPPRTNDVETRFFRTRCNDEAEALERLILTFVAPSSWDVNGGRGLLRPAEDRLIIQQTKAVHEQIDKFLRDYRDAKPLGATEPKN